MKKTTGKYSFTTAQLARKLKVSTSRICQWATQGRLGAYEKRAPEGGGRETYFFDPNTKKPERMKPGPKSKAA